MKITKQINQNRGDVLNADTINTSSPKPIDDLRTNLQSIMKSLHCTNFSPERKEKVFSLIKEAISLTEEENPSAKRITEKLDNAHKILDSVVAGSNLAKTLAGAISSIGLLFS